LDLKYLNHLSRV